MQLLHSVQHDKKREPLTFSDSLFQKSKRQHCSCMDNTSLLFVQPGLNGSSNYYPSSFLLTATTVQPRLNEKSFSADSRGKEVEGVRAVRQRGCSWLNTPQTIRTPAKNGPFVMLNGVKQLYTSASCLQILRAAQDDRTKGAKAKNLKTYTVCYQILRFRLE